MNNKELEKKLNIKQKPYIRKYIDAYVVQVFSKDGEKLEEYVTTFDEVHFEASNIEDFNKVGRLPINELDQKYCSEVEL